MTKNAGKGGRRKTPVEGFNNVPKILEEARRMVDVVIQAEPGGPVQTAQTDNTIDKSAPPAPKAGPKKPSRRKTSSAKAAAAGKKPEAELGQPAP
jgi:hypothetical protein